MKTISTTLLATIAITLTAAASPGLIIDTTIATADDHILMQPTMIVPSGELGSIISGSKGEKFTYEVRPTLLPHGKVDLQVVITHPIGKTSQKLARHIVVPLGTIAKVQSDAFIYTAKPTLEKLPWEAYRPGLLRRWLGGWEKHK